MKPQPGYVFFNFHPGLLGRGISYFSRWGAGKRRVTHAGIYIGSLFGGGGLTIESHFPKGVHLGSWAEILNSIDLSKGRRVYVAKPIGWTPERGKKIRTLARMDVGKGYDVSSIGALAVSNSLAGRLLGSKFQRWVGDKMNAKDQWFCSEHATQVVAEVIPEFEAALEGYEPHFITPQSLFDMKGLWEVGPIEITQ
jgi:hypothetical protein